VVGKASVRNTFILILIISSPDRYNSKIKMWMVAGVVSAAKVVAPYVIPGVAVVLIGFAAIYAALTLYR
jgi:hypothetical protein